MKIKPWLLFALITTFFWGVTDLELIVDFF